MKKIIITTMAITFVLTVTIGSAYAGSSDRLRKHLKGVLISSNPALLGATIINKLNQDLPKVYVSEPRQNKRDDRGRYKNRRDNRHYQYGPNRHRYMESKGHWAVKRTWVPEKYEKRWNPGHYNKRGRWVPGKYKRFVVREGYWQEKRIWVSRY
ncbi:MAG: hypothetical protein KAI40_08650 [Desulfobacterales bacterium]|nr:hypothetical protein [Desulfobacterales bacterium]